MLYEASPGAEGNDAKNRFGTDNRLQFAEGKASEAEN